MFDVCYGFYQIKNKTQLSGFLYLILKLSVPLNTGEGLTLFTASNVYSLRSRVRFAKLQIPPDEAYLTG